MKHFLLGFLLLAFASLGLGIGSSSPAAAQSPCGVNFNPTVGVNCANVRQPTYAAVLIGLVPVASATDFFCISGSASKAIHVRRITLSGTAGTLVTAPILLAHRTALDTGTVATATYVKSGAKLRSTNAAATAVVVGYNSTGGNPTIVDATPTYIRSGNVTLGISGTTAAPTDRLEWYFGTSTDAYDQGLDIPSGGTAEQYCLNLATTSVSSGVISGSMEWTED